MRKSGLFSVRLRQLITSANVTQKQLAEAVGVKPQSISQYLDGASSPSYAVLIAIADFFHVSTDYLVGRSDVSTDDMNVSAIGTALGLSEKAIYTIKGNSNIVDRLLSHDKAIALLVSLRRYHDYTVDDQKQDALSEVYRLWAGHELREAGHLLGQIFCASPGEPAMKEWKVEVVHGDAQPLSSDQTEIVISSDCDDIRGALAKALLDEVQKRGV